MVGKTMTVKQVALYMDVTPRTIHNWLKDGRFPVKPIPGTRPKRWAFEAVEDWRLQGVESRRSQGGDAS